MRYSILKTCLLTITLAWVGGSQALRAQSPGDYNYYEETVVVSGTATTLTGGGGGSTANDYRELSDGSVYTYDNGGGAGGTGTEVLGVWRFHYVSQSWLDTGTRTFITSTTVVNTTDLEGKFIKTLEGNVTSSVDAKISVAEVISAGFGYQQSVGHKDSVELPVPAHSSVEVSMSGKIYDLRFEEVYVVLGIPVPGVTNIATARQSKGTEINLRTL